MPPLALFWGTVIGAFSSLVGKTVGVGLASIDIALFLAFSFFIASYLGSSIPSYIISPVGLVVILGATGFVVLLETDGAVVVLGAVIAPWGAVTPWVIVAEDAVALGVLTVAATGVMLVGWASGTTNAPPAWPPRILLSVLT